MVGSALPPLGAGLVDFSNVEGLFFSPSVKFAARHVMRA